jgi:hypothetical protein
MKQVLPNLIIAGGTKCGSTSLFFWLAAHPDVCASTAKETHFFHDEVLKKWNGSANIHEHGLDAYSDFFKNHEKEKIVVEATPQYLHQDTPLTEIPKLGTKPKIIFLLREPVKRAFSQYVYAKHRLNQVDHSMTFEAYLKHGSKRGKQLDILGHSSYSRYLKKWLDVFDPEDIWVYQSEVFFKDKLGFMKDLSIRLGIDPKFYDTYSFLKRNESSGIRNRTLHSLAQKAQNLFGDRVKERLLIPIYLKFNSKPIPKEEVLEDEVRIRLEKRLWGESTRELFELFPHLNSALWYPNLSEMESQDPSE